MSAPEANASASASSGTTTGTGRIRQGEMSDFDKGRIVGWSETGVSKREIARRLGRNESTIRQFLKRYAGNQSPQNAKRYGRPTKLTEEVGEKILGLISRDPTAMKADLQQQIVQELQIELHPRTVDRFLKGKGYRKSAPKK